MSSPVNVEISKLIQFQLEMAEYFRTKATITNEDREYWASLYNEENCRQTAIALRAYEAA